MSVRLSVCQSINIHILKNQNYRLACLFVCISCLSVCLSIYIFSKIRTTDWPVCLFVYHVCLSVYQYTYSQKSGLYIEPSVCLSICLFVYLSVCLSVCLSIMSVWLSCICLAVCLSQTLAYTCLYLSTCSSSAIALSSFRDCSIRINVFTSFTFTLDNTTHTHTHTHKHVHVLPSTHKQYNLSIQPESIILASTSTPSY